MKRNEASRARALLAGVGTVLALFWLSAVQAQIIPCSSPTLDSDGDGIPDIYDNCINVANPDQRDTTGTGIGNACNPDLNHDGLVNAQDLALFKIAYAAYNSTAHTYTPNADFNGDGKIDTADLAILQNYLNRAPGPSANAPAMQVVPTTLNFGTPFVGVPTTLQVTVKNTGCLPVQILNATLTGSTAFKLISPTALTLVNPGQTATISITFTAQSTAPVIATLNLTTNTGKSVLCVTLTGTGVNPAPGQVPILVAPTSLSFGTVSPGGSASQTLTIGNAGTAPLVVSNIPPNDSQFTVDPSLLGGYPLVLAPGVSESMPVNFTAGNSLGPLASSLSVANNDPLRSNWNVNLLGTVVAPAPVTVNNPVTSVQVFDGNTPITAANCSSVTRAITFGAGTNSADSYQVVMTDATGKSITSAAFSAPSSPGTQVLSGINTCGLADSTITTSVVYLPAGGAPPPPLLGTPATKDTSPTLPPPTLTPPSAPYFTSSNANICGTSRANTMVTINGGTSPVSTVLNSATTTFCMSVPLVPNQQNTLIATAIDELAAAPRPSESSTPLLVTQVNPSQVVIASATSTPLDASQVATLVANGVINLQNPANFNISIFTIVLTIGSFPVTVTQPVAVPIQSAETSVGTGETGLGGGGGWGGGGGGGNSEPAPTTCTESCSTIIAIQPPQGPVIPGILIIDGTIKTLKEFFQVTLAVQNTSSLFTLSNVGSSLSLPAGSLTAVSAGVGTNLGTLTGNGASTIALGSIVPGATGTGQYIIRGDAIGSYRLAVQYNGFITGGGLPNGGIAFNGSANTSVQVLGPPSLAVVVHFPQPAGTSYNVVAGEKFTLAVDITNTSKQPALYPSLDLVVGGNLSLLDPTTLLPVAQVLHSLPNINSGQTVTTSFLMQSSAQGYVIACQGLSSTNVSLSVDIGDQGAACNIANTIPAAFAPPAPNAPPTVLGINPANGQGNQPITTSVVADLTPVSACLTGDAFSNVVTAPINPANPAAGVQVTSADLATQGTFYIEELDASGNAVRHVPVELQSLDDPVNGTTVGTLRLGLASPLSQYFLKSLTKYRVTLLGADVNSPSGAVCNAANQAPLAQTYQWTFQTALSCASDTAPTATLSEPVNGATGQLVNTPIIVNFTNFINGQTFAVDPTNALNDSFAVFAGASIVNGEVSGGTLVPGGVGLTNQGKTLTFTPSGKLPYSAPIVMRLKNNLADLCGTPLATAANGVQLFSFQTAAAPVTPPAPPVVNPLTTALTNLPAVQVTGAAPAGTTVTILGGASPVSGAAAGGGLFNVSVPLVANQKNSFSVTAIDSAGNVSSAVTTDINGKPLSVQSDQTPPAVTTTIPTNGATGVAVASAISVAFSKPINTGTANTLNAVLTTSGVPVAGTVSGSGSALTVTPAAPLTTGTQYQLTLRAGGVSDLAGNTLASAYIVSFTTVAGTPTLTAVAPSVGTLGTTFPVIFTGTTLSAASAVVSGTAGISGTITAASASSVSASISISPTAAVGTTTLGLLVGGTSITVPFTVTAATPSVTSITPAAGTAGNTMSVTFAGTNLSAAAAVVSGNSGITGTITAAGATSVSASIKIASSAAVGPTTLGLTIGGTNFSATFTVIAAVPAVTSVSPASGVVGTTFPVTFAGTNLTGATAVASGNPGISGAITGAPTSTSVSASITITAAAATGTTTLGLVIGGQTYSVSFVVNSAAPALTSITPAAGTVGTSFPVIFTGTNLAGTTTVTSANAGVTGSITGVPTSTSVTALITIGSAAATGATTLGIIVGGTTLSLPFTVNAATPALTSITPNSGTVGSTVTVTFIGTSLTGTTAVVSGNAGVSGTIVGTPAATSVTASVVIASTAATGATTLGIVVGGKTLSLPFTVNSATPALTSIAPNSGTVGTTFTVAFGGTNLIGTTAVVSGNAGVSGTIVGTPTATSVTGSVTITSGAATGATTLGIVVGGQTLSLPFTVNAATPTISTLTPASGQQGHTVSVVIAGTNLLGITGIGVSGGGVTAAVVPGGTSSSQTASFVIASTAATGARTVSVTTAAGTASATFTVNPAAPLSVSLLPNPLTLATESTTTLTVTLSDVAPSGGQIVNLATGGGLVAFTPSSVTIPQNATSATVSVASTATAGSDLITASGSGIASGTDSAQVQARGFSLSVGLVGVGRSVPGVVTLTQPAPSTGATIALSVANTSLVTVAPSSVTIPSGQTTASFTLTGGSTTGSTILTANGAASGFTQQTASVTVSNAQLNLSAAQTLGFGQTATYQVQISSAAPAGGVAVTLTSSNTAVATVPATVTIPSGALSASFTVQAGTTVTGSSTITASNASFASTTSTVNLTAALLLAETSKTLASTLADTVDFQLTSGGNAYNAAAGGVVVTASSSDGTCVKLGATSATVAAGQSFGSVAVAYGNTATLPCTATVTLNNAVFGTASIAVTYQAASSLGNVSVSSPSTGVGTGLETPVTVSLSAAAPAGGVTVEVRSSNPGVLLVAPNGTTPGAPALNVAFAAGAASATIYVQGILGSTGNVTLTPTTPKYTTVTSVVAVVPSGISLYGPPTNTTNLAGTSTFNAIVGALYSGGTALNPQAVSPITGTVTVTATSSTPTVGALLSGGVNSGTAIGTIPVGANATSSGTGFTFVPVGNGTTTLSVSASGFASTSTNYGPATQVVTVTQSGFTLNVGAAATNSSGVGAGLEANAGSVSLGAPAPAGGITIQVTSSAPGTMLLLADVSGAANGATVGTGTISVLIPAGQSSGSFWMQGVAVGTVTITATDPSNKYASPAGIAAMTVQSAISLYGPPTNTTNLAGTSTFNAIVGALYSGGTALNPQAVSPITGTVTVTATSSAPTVGALLSGGVNSGTAIGTIPVGANATSSGTGFTFVPVGNGTTTLSVSASGFASTSTNYGPATQVVTVTQSGFTLNVGAAATNSSGVGAGLEANAGSVSLGAPAPAGGITIQVTSSAPGTMLLLADVSGAANGATVGTGTISVLIPAGQSSGSFWMQGVAVGTVTITATDPSNKYASPAGIAAMTVQSAISLYGPPTNTTNLAGTSTFNAIVGALYSGGTALNPQAVSPITGTVTVTATSSTPTVGALLSGGVNSGTAIGTIPVGANATSSGTGFTFVPVGNGTTTLSVSASGFASTSTNYGPATQVVTVTQSGFTLNVGAAATNSSGVGAGLEANAGSVSLGAPAPAGGITIQVTSSAPGTMLLLADVSGAANGATVGTGTISVLIPAGQSSGSFWMQGVAVGTATITATDPSNTYSSPAGVAAMTVQSAISLYGPPTSATPVTPQSPFNAIVGALYSGGTALNPQAVSPTTGTVTVTATSSTPTVGALLSGGVNSGTAIGTIPVGANATSSGTGFTFVPVSDGSTTLSVSASGFASTSTNYGPATQVVTVTQAAITLQGGISVGNGLQSAMSLNLQAANDGGVTINVASGDPAKLLVSPDATTAGTSFINISLASGTSSYTFYVQGVAGGGTGAVTVTASTTDTAFATGSATVNVAEPQLVFYTGLPTTEAATSADAPFQVATFVPGYTYENVAAGSALVVTLSSSSTAAADLTTSSQTRTSPVTVTLTSGTDISPSTVAGGGVALHAVGVGTTSINATAPGTLPATQTVILD